jgi:hypothetical protein
LACRFGRVESTQLSTFEDLATDHGDREQIEAGVCGVALANLYYFGQMFNDAGHLPHVVRRLPDAAVARFSVPAGELLIWTLKTAGKRPTQTLLFSTRSLTIPSTPSSS